MISRFVFFLRPCDGCSLSRLRCYAKECGWRWVFRQILYGRAS